MFVAVDAVDTDAADTEAVVDNNGADAANTFDDVVDHDDDAEIAVADPVAAVIDADPVITVDTVVEADADATDAAGVAVTLDMVGQGGTLDMWVGYSIFGSNSFMGHFRHIRLHASTKMWSFTNSSPTHQYRKG